MADQLIVRFATDELNLGSLALALLGRTRNSEIDFA
jgi:hypothetical protein